MVLLKKLEFGVKNTPDVPREINDWVSSIIPRPAAEAALSPAAYSMITDYFPKDKLGRAIGVYVIGLYLGAGIAMIVGSAVISYISTLPEIILPLYGLIKPWQLAFILVSLPGILRKAGVSVTPA